MAIAVVAIFGTAAFATNARLMLMLKSQRETTAATMMLQERMEAFRSLSYSGVGSNTASVSPNPPATAADIVANTTTSETQLGGISGSLSETITVSGYMDTSGNCPPTTAAQNRWIRNSSSPTGSLQSPSSSVLATNYDLLKVDIQLSWASTNGRTRQQEISSVFGKGNLGITP